MTAEKHYTKSEILKFLEDKKYRQGFNKLSPIQYKFGISDLETFLQEKGVEFDDLPFREKLLKIKNIARELTETISVFRGAKDGSHKKE